MQGATAPAWRSVQARPIPTIPSRCCGQRVDSSRRWQQWIVKVRKLGRRGDGLEGWKMDQEGGEIGRECRRIRKKRRRIGTETRWIDIESHALDMMLLLLRQCLEPPEQLNRKLYWWICKSGILNCFTATVQNQAKCTYSGLESTSRDKNP